MHHGMKKCRRIQPAQKDETHRRVQEEREARHHQRDVEHCQKLMKQSAVAELKVYSRGLCVYRK